MSIKIFLSKEERAERKKKRKEKKLIKKELRRQKLSTRKWVLPAVILSVIVYTLLDVILQLINGSEISPTLTTCWFTFWAVELWNLASITKKKVDVDYEGSFSGNLEKLNEDDKENDNPRADDDLIEESED